MPWRPSQKPWSCGRIFLNPANTLLDPGLSPIESTALVEFLGINHQLLHIQNECAVYDPKCVNRIGVSLVCHAKTVFFIQ